MSFVRSRDLPAVRELVGKNADVNAVLTGPLEGNMLRMEDKIILFDH